ncbi:hypothetical protein FLLO111716_03855 [Flavobacterium longum]|uniref:lipocalin family protein n=1 Tax=Flavobacterium longum TaxID=1299340 RepID=UPI0039ED4C5F
MKKITFLALLLVTTVGIAQNDKLIIGKWAFSDLYDKSSVDEQGQQMAAMLFKELTINFRPDNTMSLAMRKKPETGTYAFSKENPNEITATSERGNAMTLTIIKLTADELILTLDKAGSMILKKVSATPDDAPVATPKVAATHKQITGKWMVTGSTDKKLSEAAAEIMKDSFVEFTSDGKYHSKALMVEQHGTWAFGAGNMTINVDTEDGKAVWNIYAISDTELIMQNDTSSKRMTFVKKG